MGLFFLFGKKYEESDKHCLFQTVVNAHRRILATLGKEKVDTDLYLSHSLPPESVSPFQVLGVSSGGNSLSK